MNGNSKSVIFDKAVNALSLADFWKNAGNAEMEKIWRDEYDKNIKRYLGIR